MSTSSRGILQRVSRIVRRLRYTTQATRSAAAGSAAAMAMYFHQSLLASVPSLGISGYCEPSAHTTRSSIPMSPPGLHEANTPTRSSPEASSRTSPSKTISKSPPTGSPLASHSQRGRAAPENGGTPPGVRISSMARAPRGSELLGVARSAADAATAAAHTASYICGTVLAVLRTRPSASELLSAKVCRRSSAAAPSPGASGPRSGI
mmetsp:Transcript_15325/g.36460  ORF Transcript_15325/g.36460 Transcript_15325/m.36460 type:complete len:207 (+) Transcript_15325:1021-1641(+)